MPSNGSTASSLVDDESGTGNDTVATAQVLGGPRIISGSDGDRDWYSLTLATQSAVTFRLVVGPINQETGDPATAANLYEDSPLTGELPSVAVGPIAPGTSCQVLDAGTYLILVRDSDLVEGGQYSLLVEPVAIV